jgi:8-oxo-dGTP pyrophosphatase MutT (NUDIX family)
MLQNHSGMWKDLDIGRPTAHIGLQVEGSKLNTRCSTSPMPRSDMQRRRGRQCAALPVREKNGEVEVLLVTSRDTRRWVLPKGWTERQHGAAEQAAVEAFEEAGIRGAVSAKPIGSYAYLKRTGNGRTRPCRVEVFRMQVAEILDEWPEKAERERRWFTLPQAAMAVEEGGLVTLMLSLAMPEA